MSTTVEAGPEVRTDGAERAAGPDPFQLTANESEKFLRIISQFARIKRHYELLQLLQEGSAAFHCPRDPDLRPAEWLREPAQGAVCVLAGARAPAAAAQQSTDRTPHVLVLQLQILELVAEGPDQRGVSKILDQRER